MRAFFPLFVAASIGLLPATLSAKEDEEAAAERAAAGQAPPTRGTAMLYGPVFSCSLEAPKAPGDKSKGNPPLAAKAVVVKLGEHDEACAAFDTELLRMAAGWTGGFLNLKHTNAGTYKGDGTGAAVVAGELAFRTPAVPGWTASGEPSDPRPRKGGPLPREAGHYKGLYLNGSRTVFSYEALGREVLESPEVLQFENTPVLVRHFTVGPSPRGGSLLVAESGGVDSKTFWLLSTQAAAGAFGMAQPIAPAVNGHTRTLVVIGDTAKLEVIPGAAGKPVLFTVPPSAKPLNFDVAILDVASKEDAAKLIRQWAALANLAPLCHGGALRWAEAITAKGTVSPDSAAYVTDTIPVPEQNPWKSWMRVSGFDFFPDGRAAVATLSGDVWIVSGIDAKLDHVTWKRYATGLYEPLGLKIIDGKVLVLGRDQITRLHDLNSDGEADYYECFNSDRSLYPSYHAFAFDLQTDSKGNLYYVTGGNQLGRDRPWHACLIKVSPDGAKSESIATGFRAPNGMEIGPNDEIAVSDNQGHWIPTSKISLVKPGGFYGHVSDPRIDPKAPVPATYDQPLLWIPYLMDNSSGGGVWVPPGAKWGPFAGHLLHTSYGTCSLFAVMEECVGDTMQAGIVRFPLNFNSGIMRARFNPVDGQLYVGGLKGWQTKAARDGCLERVRYTGKPLYLPTAFHIASRNSIAITFPIPLDPVTAGDAQSFSIEQWNYKYFSTYMSPNMSLENPGKEGHDKVEVKGAQLSSDRKTVTLTVPPLRKVEQMDIKMQVKAADGAEVHVEIGNTINRLP